MTAQADFLADPNRQEIWLAEIYPYDTGSRSAVTHYFSSGEFATLPTESPANQGYKAVLTQAWNVSLDAISPGTVGVLPAVKGGELRLGNRSGDLDYLRDYSWDGRRVLIKLLGTYRGNQRLAYADALVVFDGYADQILVGVDELTLRLRDPESSWDDPLESRRYSGSTWMLDFGSGDVVTLGSPAKLNVTGNLTVQMRVRLSSFAANNYLVSWRNSATTYPFSISTNTSGWLLYQNSDAALSGTTNVLSVDTWYTLAVTVTGTTLRLYAWREDTGALLYAATETLTTATRTAGDGNLRLGQTDAGTSSGFQLDWFRAWSVVKTQEELDDLRMRPLSADEEADATCLASYRAEEGSGTTLTDYAGTPANGTISGCDWRPSLEGGSDLEGQAKPNAWGKVENASPALVYAPTQIYQVHTETVSAIDAVREGGNSITAGTAYTNLLTFLAATTTAGQYDTLITAGGTYFRLGTNPSKPVTVDLQGDASGSGYVSTAGDIVRRIVTTRGANPLADPGDLDTTSFTDLNTANGAVCGYFAPAGSETTVRVVVNDLLASIGAVAWFGRSSRDLTVKRLEALGVTSKVLTFDENDLAKLEPLPVELPVGTVEVRYRKNWTPLSTDQLAGSVVGTANEAFYVNEWRSVTRSSAKVKREHARARTLVVESLLTTKAAAEAEAVRLLALFGTEHESWRVSVSALGAQLDRFRVVGLTYSDLTPNGAAQTRFGLRSSGRDFWVLGVAGSQSDGLETLVLWR